MALPAELLEKLPAQLVRRAENSPNGCVQRGLELGLEALDMALPDAGLPRGGVVELCVQGSSALATSLALLACRAAQQEGIRHGLEVPWCGFVDPTSTLHAPGVLQAGVQLNRLLVVQPPVEALSRVALRLVESQAFAVVAIDTLGAPGMPLNVNLGGWSRVVRRLSMAVQNTQNTVVLITDAQARRPLPLPVAMRLDLRRTAEDRLLLSVAKDRHGRISSPRSVAWARSKSSEPARRRTG